MAEHRRWQDSVLVVIPSIDGASLLDRMLPSMHGFPQAQVVVLDQGSTDATEAVCARHGTQLRQLGRPLTYTQACNVGAELAIERGAAYLCVCNNDIAFRTDVLAELHAEMARDPRLAIVAPAQIVQGDGHAYPPIAHRVFWRLGDVEFGHETGPLDPVIQRLEADFCELTCAMIRLSALEEVGFLDDEYGFYHEDADLGFRLRKAGHVCAYLPRSQIDHFISSTVNRDKQLVKQDYIQRNKRHFARKHLGFAVRLDAEAALDLNGPWRDFNVAARCYFGRWGLLGEVGPPLLLSTDRPDPESYVLCRDETLNPPARLVERLAGFGAVLTPSPAIQAACVHAGMANSYVLPWGVETDVFHPWGPTERLADGVVFLLLAHGQQERLIRTVLAQWHAFRSAGGDGRLVVFGKALGQPAAGAADRVLRTSGIEVSCYASSAIEWRNSFEQPSQQTWLAQCRAADCVITARHGESGLVSALQAAACGKPVLRVDAKGRAQRFLHEDQAEVALCGLLAGLVAEGAAGLEAWSLGGLTEIRSRHSLRDTAMALHRSLSKLQIRQPSRVLRHQRPVEPETEADPAPPAVPASPPSAVVPVSPPSAVGATIRPLSPTRMRLSQGVAARVVTLGRVTSDFALAWERRGLRSAAGFLGRELQYLARSRVRRMARLVRLTVGDEARAGTADALALPPPDPQVMRSTLLMGYVDAQLGLGESIRGLARAMELADIPFAIHPIGLGVEGRPSATFMPARRDTANRYAINVIELTVDELPRVRRHVGEAPFEHSYNVLRTYWELGKSPKAWRTQLDGIDEIWAPNRFVADSLRPVFDGPITVIPPCVTVPDAAEETGRSRFGLARDAFQFLFSFDYYSFPQRKNPFGVIRAFRKAFPDPEIPVGLVIKTTGAIAHFPDLKAELSLVAQDDDRVRVIDESLGREEMTALMRATDCYVSLHRAEGFGLGMAEAMLMGKPVIATDYSGSVDFVRPENAYPVRYSLQPIGAGEYVHPDGQVWAAPDEDDCAAAMRRVLADPAERMRKAEAGRRFVQDAYGVARVGRLVGKRLDRILDGLPRRDPLEPAQS